MVVPIFLPHLGCRDRCTYCHQGYITDVSGEDIKARIDAAFIHRAAPCDVGLFGGNIFGIEPAVLEKMFSFFEPYRDWVRAFRLSTKPVPLRDETIYLLKENKTDIIELGIPTFNDAILAGLNRAHTGQDLFDAYHRLKEEGFSVALQFMVGLPGENENDIENIIRNMVRLKPVYIRIYPLVVLKDTPLYALYRTGQFRPTAFDDVLDCACRIYANAVKNGISVANVGLTDNELVRDMVAGGHYHPAYGFLVQSRIFIRAVEIVLKHLGYPKDITIILHNADIPLLIGHKKQNIMKFSRMGVTVKWVPSGNNRGHFEVRSQKGSAAGSVQDIYDQ